MEMEDNYGSPQNWAKVLKVILKKDPQKATELVEIPGEDKKLSFKEIIKELENDTPLGQKIADMIIKNVLTGVLDDLNCPFKG